MWGELAGEEVVEEVCDLLSAVRVGGVGEGFDELVAEEDGGFFEWLVWLLGGDVGVEDINVVGLQLVGEVQHGIDGVVVGSEDGEGFIEEAQWQFQQFCCCCGWQDCAHVVKCLGAEQDLFE